MVEIDTNTLAGHLAEPDSAGEERGPITLELFDDFVLTARITHVSRNYMFTSAEIDVLTINGEKPSRGRAWRHLEMYNEDSHVLAYFQHYDIWYYSIHPAEPARNHVLIEARPELLPDLDQIHSNCTLTTRFTDGLLNVRLWPLAAGQVFRGRMTAADPKQPFAKRCTCKGLLR